MSIWWDQLKPALSICQLTHLLSPNVSFFLSLSLSCYNLPMSPFFLILILHMNLSYFRQYRLLQNNFPFLIIFQGLLSFSFLFTRESIWSLALSGFFFNNILTILLLCEEKPSLGCVFQSFWWYLTWQRYVPRQGGKHCHHQDCHRDKDVDYDDDDDDDDDNDDDEQDGKKTRTGRASCSFLQTSITTMIFSMRAYIVL